MKKIVIIIICIATSLGVFAQKRNEAEAKTIAATYIKKNDIRQAKKASTSNSVYSPYYIYMSNTDSCFVIVSGDKRMRDVLAYGKGINVDDDKMPEGMKSLLQGYKQAYERLQTSANEIKRSATPNTVAVEPFVVTEWGQGSPYNRFCPGNTVTGCVATAMAQVLKYYEYPLKGTGEINYVTETSQLPINCNLDDIDFQWDYMKNNYNYSYSERDADAVSGLMFCCGASVEMDYQEAESGTYSILIPDALMNNFGFAASTEYHDRDEIGMDDDKWFALLNNEMDAQRPVIYTGYMNSSSGHTFVIAGKDEEQRYFINWGWDGAYNGYFALEALMGYDYRHNMVTGIFPEKFKVSYFINGKQDDAILYKPGELVTMPIVEEKEGFTFTGWDHEDFVMPTHDVKVNGAYSRNVYHIAYLVDEMEYKTVDVEFDTTIPVISGPDKDGYSFAYWDGLPKFMPSHDLTVSAVYSKNKHDVTYYVDEEIFAKETVFFGERVVPAEIPEKEGYTFSGWSDIPEYMPDSDVDVYGTFNINKYKVTYILNNDVFLTDYVVFNGQIFPPIIENTDVIIFNGWKDVPAYMPAHDIVIYGSTSDIRENKDYSNVENIIYADDISVFSNQMITLNVTLKNSIEARGYQFDMYLPEEIQLMAIDKNNMPNENIDIMCAKQSDGAYRIMIYVSDITVITLGANIVIPIRMKVDKVSTNITRFIKFGNCSISYYDGATHLIKSKSLSETYTKVSISSGILGDVNNDGNITITDVVNISNHILGKANTIFNTSNADANEDGVISITDVTYVVYYILHGNFPTKSEAKKILITRQSLTNEME